MAKKKKPAPVALATFDDLDSAGIGSGYRPAFTAPAEETPQEGPKARGFLGAANDTVIEFANAAAGGIKAATDFVAPGNRVGRALGDFIEHGEASQSDVVKAEKEKFRGSVAAAEGFGDELAAVGRYVTGNPLLTAAQAAGSFVLPGAAVKGAGAAASAMGTGARGASMAGRAGGVAAGTAMAGGDAGGNAYELVMQAPMDTLLQHPDAQRLAQGGADEDAIRQTLATAAARDASIVPALLGGVTGAFGAERLLAGGVRKAGAAGVARAAGSEALQEGVEEGVTQYEGQRAAADYVPDIDPRKGVAAAAGMGAVMGGGVGAGAAIASRPPEPAKPAGPLARAAGAAPVAAAVGLEPGNVAGQDGGATVEAEPEMDPVLERIKTLQGADRTEALAAYSILNREDAPKGVRQYNSKLLDHLLAKLDPVEDDGTTPVESADPAALLAQGMGRDPVQGAIAERRDEETAVQNLQTWMERAQPLALDHAQELQAAAAERGMAMEVVPHDAGQGFTVVPAAWLTPAMRGQVGAALPLDTAPTGVLRADARGNVAPETGAQAIDARNTAAAQAAERQRKNDLGLTPDVEAVQAGVKRQPLPTMQAGDVGVKKTGKPFGVKAAALKAQKAAGGGEVVQVQGGWVLRTAAAAPAVQQELEGANVSDGDAAVALATGDGGQRGDDDGAGGRDPAAAGGDAGGDVVLPAGSPAAGSPEGAAVRDAAGEPATAVAGASIPEGGAGRAEKAKPATKTAAGGERWTAADAPAREALLLAAGWKAGSPGLEKMKGQAWDKMTQGQRNRIAKAVEAAPATAAAAPAAPEPKAAEKTQETTDAQDADRTDSDVREQPAEAVPSVRNADAGDGEAGAAAAEPVAEAASDAGPAPVGSVGDAPVQGSDADAGAVEQPGADGVAKAAPKATTIQDTGEKIGGARKDRWKERGLAVTDLDEMSDTEGAELAVKQNVWKPDYAAMVEAGATARAVASVKLVYDRLAAKPKSDTPAGRRQYVQMMQHVRDVYGAVKTEADFKAAKSELLYGKLKWTMGDAGSNERARQNAQGLDDLVVHMKQAKAMLFSVYKGRSDPFYFDYQDDRKAGAMVSEGFPAKGEPWKRRLVVRGQNGRNITPAGVRIYTEESAALGTPLTEEQLRGDFYQVRTVGNGKAVGYFTTKEDAEVGAKVIYERDLKATKDEKAEPDRPHLDKVKREGMPQRIDRDVTTEDFIGHFGFRGVEFGNWSAQDERQRILNMAYDGLADLAEIMGVPPKAMSLNGTMGMAFGARGGGRFAAHYEPGKLVINMTKLRGGGSLAHEWAHALDHYFGELDQPDAYKGKARGASGWYTEGQYNGVPITRHERQADGSFKKTEKMRLANLRPELAAALDRVMNSLFQAQVTKAEMVRELEASVARAEARAAAETDPQLKKMYEDGAASQRQNLEETRKDPEDKTYPRGKSEFSKEASKLSGKGGREANTGYWLRPTEMFARAFESWVFDRVVAMGARSDYLVHGVEETRFAGGAYKGNPYPVGKERAAINAAFDAMARTVKTKETDKGVAMFRRTGGTAVAGRADAIQKFVDGITAKWENAPKIVVVANMQDAKVPQEVRDADAGQRDQGSEGQVHGFHYRGAVYLVAEALPDAQTALTTLAHEALGHHGLQGFFGEALKPIKQQIVIMRRKEVLAKAEAYGMPVTPEAVRAELGKGATAADVKKVIDMRLLYAAEEVLAEMAQTTPQLGFVKRAIAAIRTWLRDVAGLKLELSDDEIIRSFILPARGWVVRGEETGRRRESAQEPATQFSRGAAGNILATDRPLREQIMQAMNDTFTAPGKISWWHKTIGTQYNLAQRSPAFKRVFDSVQDFLHDVSLYATEAADLAPKILPKLETWHDIGKSPIKAEDNKAISAPIFEGTLVWARDERGQPVKVEDLRKQAEGLSAQEKAQRMLRAGAISEQVLKMWQGLPIEQYEAAVATRFDSQMLRSGIVWSDAELKSQFNLTPEQIALYREFRAAVDRSVTQLAISDMVRFGGEDVATVRQEALDSPDVDAAALILRDHLMEQAKAQPDRNDVLLDTAERMVDKADRARDLMDRGYAPLSRFGHYTVDVVDTGGERVFFGMFETAREAALMARKMRSNFPQAEIRRGTVSEEEYKLFAGVSPETVELFGELLGLEAQGEGAKNEAFQTYIKVAKANRSAMKRLIERKGIAGFSEDVGRVLAGFVYSNARQTSQNLHMGEMTRAATEVSKGEGELKDQAARLVEYIKNPQEEAQAFRGLLFAQYLGGSAASAFVNMMQPVQVTFPWLTQYGGVAKAAGQMKRALGDVMKKATGDAQLDAALKKAEEEGIVAPQEVHHLMAQARGQGVLRSGDGTPAGDARAKAANALSRLTMAWGKLFGAAEQFNRRVTFIAAYRTAIDQGMADPAGFAERAINETQFIYNKGNRPSWARGPIGSTLFTFKSYSISYVELMHRLATQGGPEGKKAALLMLGMLMLVSGAGGLPFAEDVDDLVDGVMQRLGYNFSTKLAKQQFFEGLLGKELGRIAENGLSGLPGMPVDVSGRLGLGNLLPGTGLLVQRPDHTRDVAEIAGVGGDFIARMFKGGEKALQGDLIGAGKEVAPRAALNAAMGAEMFTTGIYKDTRGRKVIDVDGFDAAMKTLGFQPTDVALVQEATGMTQRLIAQNKTAEAKFADRWAKAVVAGDQDELADVRQDIARWNRNNPTTPISINRSQINKRVKAMREDKATRIARTAPKEIRETVRRELAE